MKTNRSVQAIAGGWALLLGSTLVACDEDQFAAGVMELAVDTVEYTQPDGTVLILPIDDVRVTQLVIPGHEELDFAPEAYVEVHREGHEMETFAVTLQAPAWGASDVRSCRERFHEPWGCEDYPVDTDGDRRADVDVTRVDQEDGEQVSAWARFADDGDGPLAVRMRFRYRYEDIETVFGTWSEE